MVPPTHDSYAVEAPVFVTADGRARPQARWLGRMLALVLAAWLVAVGAGGTGFGSLPPLPTHLAARPQHPAVAVHTTFVKLTAARNRDGTGRI